MKIKINIHKGIYGIIVLSTSLAALVVSSAYNYLLFHTLAEIYSIVIAFIIFIITWNSARFIDNHYLIFIGVAYLFIGSIDLVHTLAYKGMGIVVGNGANVSTQLWISARFIEATALLIAPVFVRRKVNYHLQLLIYSAISAFLFLSIFYWRIFPRCYIEGVGLTPFKIYSEYLIVALLAASIIFIYRLRKEFDKKMFYLLVSSISITAIGEVFFTLYVDVYGFFNLLGHVFKIISFYLIYKAIVESGIRRPYDILFGRLSRNRELLQKKTAKLQMLNNELESFAYTVSHDLRGPLRSIDDYSHALAEDYSKVLDTEAIGYISRIRASARKMENLINDILKLSHISTKDVKKNRFNLSQLAQKVFDCLSSEEPNRTIEFRVKPDIEIEADKNLVEILLRNLIENSIKFTANKKNARIELTAGKSNGRKVFSLKDNGIGISMEYAEKIFEPFRKFHIDDTIKGSGIGLATVRKIVKLHGGKVWAVGEINRAMTIFFTLGGEGEQENHSAHRG
ncbi:MAG: MASE3 domain-containing protein [Actinomycetota bacterium]